MRYIVCALDALCRGSRVFPILSPLILAIAMGLLMQLESFNIASVQLFPFKFHPIHPRERHTPLCTLYRYLLCTIVV